MKQFIRFFVCSGCALLFFTSAAKLVSSFGGAGILQSIDPIFLISFRKLFRIFGAFELVMVCLCLLVKQTELKIIIIAWLSTSFLIYRSGLLLLGWQRPCHCLGNLTDTLHISPQSADTAMKIILAYLLIGSYATLFWLWRQQRKTAPIQS